VTAVFYLLVVQLGWTVHAVTFDHFHDYSPDLATARFLAPHVAVGDKIAVTYLGNYGARAAHDVGILPYFSRQIYMNQDRPFWWWSTRNRTEASFAGALSERPPIVLVEFFEGRPFDPSKDTSDPKIGTIRRAGYSLTGTFCGLQPARFDYEIPICHLVFLRTK
jgi:hypothetical protein